MNPYVEVAAEYARRFQEGKTYPLGGFEPARRVEVLPSGPAVLIFAPHPDDECVIGGLALRLLREAKWRVINIAVTQGSNAARQAERWSEVQGACNYIGFELVQTVPNGLERVNPATRVQEREYWKTMVHHIAQLLRDYAPKAIFFPHEHDWNSTHIGTHFLVRDALHSLGPNFETFLIETEFWGQMPSPNLMVESSVQDVGTLMTALSFHAGEVRRNPFHLLMPAWMQDNVRRGSELVGGQGQAAPDFNFATLYRIRHWHHGSVQLLPGLKCILPIKDNPGSLFG